MFKRFIAFAALSLATIIAFAEQCPSVDQIRTNHLAGWKTLDSEDNTALTTRRLSQFRLKAEQFVLAEWATQPDSKKTGMMRCYYRDKNGSTLEAYLVKSNFIPAEAGRWYEVSGAMQCAEGNEACQFKQLVTQTRLAKK